MTSSQIQSKPNQQKALIVGVNGQDGSYLAEQLAIDNWTVYGFGRQDAARPEISQFLSRYEMLDISEIAHYQQALSKFKPDVIFYTAAVHGPAGFSYENVWADTHKVNTLGLHATLEHARLKHPALKIIYFSSAKAFGTLDGRVIDEDSPRYSNCLYSLTKNSSADLVEYYRQNHDVDASVIWLFNHESSRRTRQHFVMKVLSSLLRSEKSSTSLTNFETLDFWCDWGSAQEYMELIAKSCQTLGNEDYVLATGKTVWAREIVEELFTRRGLSVSENIATLQSREKPETVPWSVKIDKFKRTTGMQPSITGIDVFEKIYAELKG